MENSSGGNPQISVLMPVHQAERYLEEAVESILSQTFGDFELLALDDGSTDGSPQILADIAKRDGRIRVRRAPQGGLVARLNEGLVEARGAFIARMDADDVSRRDRLERQLDYLMNHPDCVAVGTGVAETDPEGRPIRPLDIRLVHEEIESRLLGGDGYALVHGTALYRRDALMKIGGYREGFIGGEDTDLHLRLAENGRLANISECLYFYRRNLDSATFANTRAVNLGAETAIRDALRRRGISTENAPKLPSDSPQPAVVWAIWANHALVAGNRDTARHYAIKAFCAAPQRHLKLLIRIWLGIQPFLWKRCRCQLQKWIEG
jgi:glycosyltransferase involved in cell wall biosynthesis